MRTTINIEDDVLEHAQLLAEVQHISLGDAVSRLARCGIRTPNEEMEKDPVSGFWVFKVPQDAPKLTSQDVQEAIEQEFVEEYEKSFPNT